MHIFDYFKAAEKLLTPEITALIAGKFSAVVRKRLRHEAVCGIYSKNHIEGIP